MAAVDNALVDRPRGDAVAVVHLFEGDAGFVKCVLDGFGVRDRISRVGVKRLRHGPGHSGPRHLQRQTGGRRRG